MVHNLAMISIALETASDDELLCFECDMMCRHNPCQCLFCECMYMSCGLSAEKDAILKKRILLRFIMVDVPQNILERVVAIIVVVLVV